MNSRHESAQNHNPSSPGKRIGLLEGSNLPPASLWLRAVAFSVDLSIALVVSAILVWILKDHPFSYFLVPVGIFFYFLLLDPPPGKMLAGIFVAVEGNHHNRRTALVLRAIGYMTLPFSLLLVIFTPSMWKGGRLIHDDWGKTRVLRRHDTPSLSLFVLAPLSLLVNACGIMMGAMLVMYFLKVGDYPQQRSKVATANAEMRNLAVALESYYIDWYTYPLPAQAESWSVIPSVTEAVAGYTPAFLTTPIVYTFAIPNDPFRVGTFNPGKPGSFAYRYGTWPLTCWILASDGPDGDADIPLVEFFSEEVRCDPNKFFTHFGGKYVVYDPSNGAKSNGDVLRWGP